MGVQEGVDRSSINNFLLTNAFTPQNVPVIELINNFNISPNVLKIKCILNDAILYNIGNILTDRSAGFGI